MIRTTLIAAAAVTLLAAAPNVEASDPGYDRDHQDSYRHRPEHRPAHPYYLYGRDRRDAYRSAYHGYQPSHHRGHQRGHRGANRSYHHRPRYGDHHRPYHRSYHRPYYRSPRYGHHGYRDRWDRRYYGHHGYRDRWDGRYGHHRSSRRGSGLDDVRCYYSDHGRRGHSKGCSFGLGSVMRLF